MISDNVGLIKASCRKSYAPFPPGMDISYTRVDKSNLGLISKLVSKVRNWKMQDACTIAIKD